MNERPAPQAVPPFEQLYALYYFPIYRRVYRMLRQREQAEDVTQEIFLKAWRGLATFDPSRGKVSGWLCRIATNAVINHLRSGARTRTMSLETLTWEPHDREEADPQTRYDAQWEQVTATLAQLPAHYRELLRLRCAGYTEVELAEHFGRTPRTIRGWLAHARVCLAQHTEVGA